MNDLDPADLAVALFLDVERQLKTAGKPSSSELTLSLAKVAAHLAIAQSIDGLRESLRSDHPLQGETLDGVRDALQAIADNIGDARR